MTRFDEPDQTLDPVVVLAERGIEIEDQVALPALIEPSETPLVTEPVNESLVRVEHSRIIHLDQYRIAGWRHAIAGSFLRRGTADRLVAVVENLPERWGLCVFDAWRPLELQYELYEAAYSDPELPPGFLAAPDDNPLTPPPHFTGGSVDVSLTLDGEPLGLGTRFDDFGPLAATAAFEGRPGPVRELRRMLYWAMRAEGFVVFDGEWWHFEIGTRRWAAITGCPPVYGPTR